MGNVDKFDQMARRYETPERMEMTKVIAEEIRSHVMDGKDKDAMDYGCGTGLVGLALMEDFASMVFIDASCNMVEQVEEKLAALQTKKGTALCCDFERQVPDELWVDYIFLVQTLLHIKDVELILRRLYDVLNEGGHLLIVDFDKNDAVHSDEVHNGFVQEELVQTLLKVGFAKAEGKTFYRGNQIFMNKDASLFLLDASK